MQVLVPSGANPHIYEPTPKQVQKALQARIWFRLGEPIETKMFNIVSGQGMRVVDLSEGINLISEEHGDHIEGKDRHIWMSPKLALQQATVIAGSLAEVFPEFKEQFQVGLQNFLGDLSKIDEEIARELKPFAGDAILVSHPAFGYYCQEFGLKQLSIEYEGKDPLPQDITRTLQEAKDSKVRAVFTVAQYNNKGAELIAKQLQLPVYAIDPYAQDYFENLQHITSLIAHD